MHCRRRSRSREDAKNEKNKNYITTTVAAGAAWNRARTKILIRHNFCLHRLRLREESSLSSSSLFEQESTKHRFGLHTRKQNVVVRVHVYIICISYIYIYTLERIHT